VDAIKVPKVFTKESKSAAAAAAPPPRLTPTLKALQELTGTEEDQEMQEILELASWAC